MNMHWITKASVAACLATLSFFVLGIILNNGDVMLIGSIFGFAWIAFTLYDFAYVITKHYLTAIPLFFVFVIALLFLTFPGILF